MTSLPSFSSLGWITPARGHISQFLPKLHQPHPIHREYFRCRKKFHHRLDKTKNFIQILRITHFHSRDVNALLPYKMNFCPPGEKRPQTDKVSGLSSLWLQTIQVRQGGCWYPFLLFRKEVTHRVPSTFFRQTWWSRFQIEYICSVLILQELKSEQENSKSEEDFSQVSFLSSSPVILSIPCSFPIQGRASNRYWEFSRMPLNMCASSSESLGKWLSCCSFSLHFLPHKLGR